MVPGPMAFYFFIWDGVNEQHVRDHGVTLDEFEDVVSHPTRTSASKRSGRPIAFGYTATGKFLACVYETIDESTVYPITAFELEQD